MADDCEKFEIDIERQLRRDLDERQERLLEAHLAGCTRCQEHKALVLRIDARLHQAGEEAARQAHWEIVERRLAHRSRRMRRAMWLVPTGLIGTAGACFAFGLPGQEALVMVAAALVTTAAAWLLRRHWFQELGRTEASRQELLVFLRKQVEGDLRAARWGSLALAALGVVIPATLLTLGHSLGSGRAVVAGGGALLLATAAALALGAIPRLKRERKELA
jgi:hypothetical protein